MPKPIKAAAPVKAPAGPKIASVHVSKKNGGIIVQHHMTSGPRPKPFVFQDPGKAVQHLKRIQSSQWRQPDRNEATAVDRTLDLNA